MTEILDIKVPSYRVDQKYEVIFDDEIEILNFIHEFGFCEIGHVRKRFNFKKSIGYLKLYVLVRLGFLTYSRAVHNKPGIYSLTQKAVTFLKLDLSVVRNINYYQYSHYMTVLNVCLALRSIYPEAVWLSERRLLQNKHQDATRHIPDGVLIFNTTRKIAIEIERTLKTKERLKDIIYGYALQKEYQGVWYFCTPEVKAAIEEVSLGFTHVTIHHLNEV